MLIVCTEYQAWKTMAEGTGSGYVRVRAREPSQSWDWGVVAGLLVAGTSGKWKCSVP